MAKFFCEEKHKGVLPNADASSQNPWELGTRVQSRAHLGKHTGRKKDIYVFSLLCEIF